MHIQGNYKMDKTSWPLLMSISPNDFRPHGRFAHIFIPKYVYVPREIFTFLDIHMLKGNPLYQLTWQFCYAARREADKWTTLEDIDESVSHWTDILLNMYGLNNMNLSLIDVVQAQAAHKWKDTMTKEETDPYVWYDLFIRPVEVLFARKAAMNDKLVYALKCQQHTTDLFQLVCNLVNLPNTIPLMATECVEEMSKVRHLPYRDTIASVVIQAIGSGMNEETLMKATHPMIRLGQFGICTKLVEAIGHCLHILVNHKSH
jgi:hypothetical protein